MAKKLTEVLSAETLELVNKEIEAHEGVTIIVNETADGKSSYVPIHRLNEVIGERESLKATNATLNTSLEGLKQGNKDNEGLQTQISGYETKLSEQQTASDEKLKQVKFDNKFEIEVMKLNPTVSAKAVAALFDKSKISLDGENLIGFNDQATVIMEGNKPLFQVEKEDLPKGDDGAGGAGAGKVKNPFAKETHSLIEQIKLKRTNSALYDKMKAEASEA